MQLMPGRQHWSGGLVFFLVDGNLGNAVGQFLADANDSVEALLQSDVLLLQCLNAFNQTFGFIGLTTGEAVDPAGLAQCKNKRNNRHRTRGQKHKAAKKTVERKNIHHCTHRDVSSEYA